MANRKEMQSELKEAEDHHFKEFLAKIGFNSIQEYEQSDFNEVARDFNDKKNQLM